MLSSKSYSYQLSTSISALYDIKVTLSNSYNNFTKGYDTCLLNTFQKKTALNFLNCIFRTLPFFKNLCR